MGDWAQHFDHELYDETRKRHWYTQRCFDVIRSSTLPLTGLTVLLKLINKVKLPTWWYPQARAHTHVHFNKSPYTRQLRQHHNTYIYIYIHTYIHTYTYTYIYIIYIYYVCLCVCVCVCMCQTQDNFTGMKLHVWHKITRAKMTPHPANIPLNTGAVGTLL